jgi:hypothetical protein
MQAILEIFRFCHANRFPLRSEISFVAAVPSVVGTGLAGLTLVGSGIEWERQWPRGADIVGDLNGEGSSIKDTLAGNKMAVVRVGKEG